MAVDLPPRDLAVLVADRPRPLLVGLDVDGVLAPIVERADQAMLLPGVIDALIMLAPLAPVAVVSGRAVDDLEVRYGFPRQVTVVGSHGLEMRDRAAVELDDAERRRLDRLVGLAEAAARAAGDGAWVEHKPASIVVHVREADPDAADEAIATLLGDAASVPGAHVKRGHHVVELMTRHASKASAIAELRERHDAVTVVFAGDDDTDEEVFATLGDTDVSIRVGPGDTSARYRLPDPPAVLAWLQALVACLRP